MLNEYDFSKANINTTDKVQVGDSTTGTSTSTTYKSSSPPMEYGWACPRCGRINAPWKSQCDCSGKAYWYPTWEGPYYDEWWKHVTCAPETTWKAPSSVCGSDSTIKQNPNSTIYTTAHNPVVGGSDYKEGHTYVNVGGTQSNKVEPNVTAWSCTNPDIAVNDFTTYRTDVPKTYTTINDNLEPLTRHFKD